MIRPGRQITSAAVLFIPALFLLSILVFQLGDGFPQGAPAESCDSLLPRHIHTKGRGPRKSPYSFWATDYRYSHQDEGIGVDIGGAPFKGFFVAAIDPATHKRIGSFIKVKGTEVMPCAAVTHTDPFPKIHVRLIWTPPRDQPSGQVVFMATIVQSFTVYYTNLIAAVPVYSGYQK